MKSQRKNQPTKSHRVTEPVSANRKKPSFWLFRLSFMVLAFVFYGNSIQNGFSMDDDLVTSTDREKHPIIEEGISATGKIFSSRYAHDPEQAYSYRPLTIWTFALEWDLVGEGRSHEERARNHHVVSALSYGLSCIVLFNFLLLLIGKEGWLFASVTTLLFLAHPIHSEVVNNIKGRDEMLAFIFGFQGGIFALKYVDSKKAVWLVCSAVFVVLGILSKASAITAVALIPLSIYYFRSVNLKQALAGLGIAVGAIVIARIVKKLLLSEDAVRHYGYFENPLYFGSFTDRIPVYFHNNLWYAQKLVLPYPLNYYYGYDQIPVVGFGSVWFFAGIAFVGALLFLAWRGFKKKRVSSYIALFYLLAIGGVCNLLFPLPGIVAERFAFVASVALCMAASAGILWLLGKTVNGSTGRIVFKYAWLILPVVISVSLGYSIHRNPVWQSRISLYKADIGELKNSAKAHSLLAGEYYRAATELRIQNQLSTYPAMLAYADSAQKLLERCTEICPQYSTAWNNMGTNLMNFRLDADGAIRCFRMALDENPLNHRAMNNLAGAYGTLAEIYLTLSRVAGADSASGKVVSPDQLEHFTREVGVNNDGVLLLLLYKAGHEMLNAQNGAAMLPAYLQLMNIYHPLTKGHVDTGLFGQSVQSGISSGQQFPTDLGILFGWNSLRKVVEKAAGQNIAAESYASLSNKYQQRMGELYDSVYSASPEKEEYFQQEEQVLIRLQAYPRLLKVSRLHMRNHPKRAARMLIQLANVHGAMQQSDSSMYYYELAEKQLGADIQSLNASGGKKDLKEAAQKQQELQRLQQHLQTLRGGAAQ